MNIPKFFTLATTLGLLCFTSTNSVAEENSSQPLNTVHIEQGALRGKSNNGVNSYLGIPYAQAPTGELRWQSPHDPLPWKGTRDATQFGNACAQIGNFYTSDNPADFDRPYGSEDCLFLNVWTPQNTNEKKSVIVFIHGGAAVHGSASLALYNGRRIAEELDAVVVSINYRLGFFGNLHLDALRTGDPTDDSGSFALLDQIKALDWVQRNIANFGGDTTNITLMGQSAGCGSIWTLMQSPLATNKFGKAICLSGIPSNSTKKEQTATSHKVLAKLLISDKIIKKPEQLDLYLKNSSNEALRNYLYNKSAAEIAIAAKGIPVVPAGIDGYVVSRGRLGSLVNPVPALIGVTHDEAPILFLHSQGANNYTGLWNLIHSEAKPTKRDFFDSRYNLLKHKFTSWAADIYLHHLVDESAEMLLDNSVPVYRYYFDWSNMPQPWKSLIGAYHGIDIPFLFGNFGIGTQNFTHFTWGISEESERELIHQQMITSIRGFIESSDPNKYAPELNWQQWQKGSSIGMRFK